MSQIWIWTGEVLRRASVGKEETGSRVNLPDCMQHPRLDQEREPTPGDPLDLVVCPFLRIYLLGCLGEKTSMWSPLFDFSPW